MTAQRSTFTLAGDSFLPLNEQFGGRLVQEGHLVKVELPPDTFDDVEEYLRMAGLRVFTYFPDLEGLGVDHEVGVAARLRDTRKFFPHLMKRK